MALNREKIENGYKLFCCDFFKRIRWYKVHNHGSKRHRALKKYMNRYIWRLPLEDTPIGKTGRKPTKGWEW